MTDNFVRREVQRRDDPFGIPACFYWTIDEVADWVDSIGYGKYKENFRSHFINGRKLLTVDACALPKMGITHFGDILSLTKVIECLGNSKVAESEFPKPGPRPVPPRLSEMLSTQVVPVPWYEQRRHLTLMDYVASQNRMERARLAGRRQYYMAP